MTIMGDSQSTKIISCVSQPASKVTKTHICEEGVAQGKNFDLHWGRGKLQTNLGGGRRVPVPLGSLLLVQWNKECRKLSRFIEGRLV